MADVADGMERKQMSYEDKKHIRLIVPADQLREMMVRHPEVEIEVLKNAIPQIAEEMRRRAKNDVIDDITERVRERFVPSQFPYRLPDCQIESWVRCEMKKLIDRLHPSTKGTVSMGYKRDGEPNTPMYFEASIRCETLDQTLTAIEMLQNSVVPLFKEEAPK